LLALKTITQTYEGHRTQDTGHRTQDTGHRTRDTGLRTQDSGLLFLLIFMLFLNVRGKGQTVITANNPITGNYEITQDETWNYDTSYVVTCNIIVKNGATFSLKPVLGINRGISIYFYPNTKLQIVDGKLNSIGEVTRRIKFTSAVKVSTLMWKGLQFESTPNNSHSEINYCIIEYIEKDITPACGPNASYDGAIFLYDFDNITISNCIIRNNLISKRGGGVFIGSSGSISYTSHSGYPQIFNNEIYNNTAQRGGGICVFSLLPWSTNSNHAYAQIENNNIHTNTAYEGGGGIAIMSYSNATIDNNILSNNVAYCNISTFPVSGGGGIVVGQTSFANIINNSIFENNSIYNISNNNTGMGGGILVRIGSDANLSNNSIFYNNSSYGGGIAIVNGIKNSSGGPSFALINDNQIFENIASEQGGGVFIKRSYCEAFRNDIYNNEAQYGGGLTISSTEDYTSLNQFHTNISSFENNKFYANKAFEGAGIFIQSEYENSINFQNYLETNLDFYNNLLHDNISEKDGAAVYLNSNINLNFHNNTIVDNSASMPSLQMGDGIFVIESSFNNDLSFINNIIYDNGLQASFCQIYHPNHIPGQFENNNILNLGCQIDPNSNHDFNPQFVDPLNNFYQLQQSSLLIDLGWNYITPLAGVDLDNNPRIINTNIDLGAYEFDGPPARKAKHLDSVSLIELAVYPNPTKNIVVISSNDLISSVELSNMDGKILFSTENILNSYYTLDVSSFKPGVYFVRIYHHNSIETIKLLKE
jgi:hypothetical protein